MILEFKPKTRLPKDMKWRIDNLANEYVDILSEACDRIVGDNASHEEYVEVTDLVVKEWGEALEKALQKL